MGDQRNNEGRERISGSESDEASVSENEQVRGLAEEEDGFDDAEELDEEDTDDEEDSTF